MKPFKMILFAIVLIATGNSMEAQIDSSQYKRLENINQQMQEAAKEELPAFAPNLFREAEKTNRKANRILTETGPGYEAERALILAEESTTLYIQRAGPAKALLFETATNRGQLNLSPSSDLIRAVGSEELAFAERLYRSAIKKAEDGNLAEAESLLPKIQGQYDAAYKKSYAALPIGSAQAQLANQLAEIQHKMAVLEQADPSGGADGLDDLVEVWAAPLPPGLNLSISVDGLIDGGLDPFPPPPDPCPLCPESPIVVDVTNRTPTSISIAWLDNNFDEDGYRIYRTIFGNKQLIGTLAGIPGRNFDRMTFTENGLTAGVNYCYQVVSFNSEGESYPKTKCAYTRDADDHPVWRLQISLKTADFFRAQSDDQFSVEVMTIQGQLYTYTNIDNGKDDFERGNTDKFDLNLDNILWLSDINNVRLRKKGNSDVEYLPNGQTYSDSYYGLEELKILVNGKSVYQKYFGNTESTALVMEGADNYAISKTELRTSAAWQNYLVVPVGYPGTFSSDPGICYLTIGRVELKERMEGIMGHLIHDRGFEEEIGYDLYWDNEKNGADWVELSFLNEQEIQLNYDLKAEVTGSNPEVNVDLKLRLDLNCLDDNRLELILTATIIDIQANNTGLFAAFDFITFGLIDYIANLEIDANTDTCEGLIKRKFYFDIPPELSEILECFEGNPCPEAAFDEDSNLVITIGS